MRSTTALVMAVFFLTQVGVPTGADAAPGEEATPIRLMEARLPGPLMGASAVWANDQAFIFGGGPGGYPSDTILRYDPVADDLDDLGDIGVRLPHAVAWTSAVWTGQEAYIFGGKTPSGTTADIVRFDPATGVAETVGELPQQPLSHTAAVWTGTNAFLFGGKNDWSLGTDSTITFSPISHRAEVVRGADLPDRTAQASAVWSGSHAYIFSGAGGGSYRDAIYRYQPHLNGDLEPGVIELAATTYRISQYPTAAVWDGDSAHILEPYGRIEVFDPVPYGPAQVDQARYDLLYHGDPPQIPADPTAGEVRDGPWGRGITWSAPPAVVRVGSQAYLFGVTSHSGGPQDRIARYTLPEHATSAVEHCIEGTMFTVNGAPRWFSDTKVGSPDLDEDNMGDCWARYYMQQMNEVLDLVSDLDCDTLNNFEEFRWQTHPIYDAPPDYALDHCQDSVPALFDPDDIGVLFQNGRDLDMDYLIDGHEARYIIRSNNGPDDLTWGDVAGAPADFADGQIPAYALFHPLKDHDSDEDGFRDMEDRNSDSHATEGTGGVSDTIMDGIEVWLLGTFPDRGDSDCNIMATTCYGADEMILDDRVSDERGTGDGLSDSLELWYWTVVAWEDKSSSEAAYALLNTREPDVNGDEGVLDSIDNVLLDPNVDGDGLGDAEDGILATLSHLGCNAEFDPFVRTSPSEAPGGPPEGGLDDGAVTLVDVIEGLRTHSSNCATGSSADASTSTHAPVGPASCLRPDDPDSDDDGVLDGHEVLYGLDPCSSSTFGIPDQVYLDQTVGSLVPIKEVERLLAARGQSA